MDKRKTGTMAWNIDEISKALKINVEDVKEYFTDGRRISFILERRICREIIKGKMAPSEGAGYDLLDPKGGKWEVRSISSGGLYFCPSYMVGSGRKFNEKGFLDKLEEIEGYIISDIDSFPNVPFWIITKQEVLKWWKEGILGSSTKISRNKILELMKE
jgi:hypothetical protein